MPRRLPPRIRHAIQALVIGLPLVAATAPASAADAYEYCEISDNPRTHAFLLDRTAGYADEDVERLLRGVQRWSEEEIRAGDRIVVRKVTDSVVTAEVLVDNCLPGCPPRSKLPWYDSCNASAVDKDKADFRRKFLAAFDAASLKVDPTGKETALAHIIYDTAKNRKIDLMVIFSDFLEHHPTGEGAASFYVRQDFNGYLHHLGKSHITPKLGQSKVFAFGFGKELGTSPANISAAQWNGIYQFWIRYFKDAGITSISIEREYRNTATPVASTEPKLR